MSNVLDHSINLENNTSTKNLNEIEETMNFVNINDDTNNESIESTSFDCNQDPDFEPESPDCSLNDDSSSSDDSLSLLRATSSIDFSPDSPNLDTAPNTEVPNKVVKTPKRVRDRDNCLFCNILVLNFARHICRNHPNEIHVQEISSKPVGCKERTHLISLLRKKGNHILNSENCVKPTKKSRLLDMKEFLPCTYCLGYYSRRQLWRHKKKCSENTHNIIQNGSQCHAQNFLIKHLKIDQELKDKVFPRMRPDSVSLTAKKDLLICEFASRYIKLHRGSRFINVVSRKMREIAKVLIEVKKLDPAIKNLFHALISKKYDLFAQATKILALYDEEKQIFLSPTYAVNIGTTLKQCCDLAIAWDLKKENVDPTISTTDAEANLNTMIKLFESNWRFEISNQASSDLNVKKWNNVTMVSLTSDLSIFKSYLCTTANEAAAELNIDNKNSVAYATLLETVYCRVILLNRRRPEKLERLQVHHYEVSETISNEDILSPTEIILMKSLKHIVIPEEQECDIPVLFSLDVQNHINILLKYRSNFIITTNPYLFGRPSQITSVCEYKTLKKYANKCGAKTPMAITSTKLHRHITIITQILNMTQNDLEQLTNFMKTAGICIELKRPSNDNDISQTEKVSKLLWLIENGTADQYKNKTFYDIDLNLDEDLLSQQTEHFDENFDNQNYEMIPSFALNENTLPSTSCNTEQKPRRKNEVKKRRFLVPWTTEQKKVVCSFFQEHIVNKIPPKVAECKQLISRNEDLLGNKSWLKIKVFVQNKYTNKLK